MQTDAGAQTVADAGGVEGSAERSRERAGPTAFRGTARRRTLKDFLRKLGAVLLVLLSATVGLLGLGTVVGDMGIPRGYGVLLILAMPVGLWFALMLTPEGGTSGYCDQNI